jgi:hypothetical protein
MLLELRALDRREVLVEQHQRRARGGERVLQLFDLALAQVEVGRRRVDALDDPADDLRAGGVREPLELLEMLIDMDRVVRPLAGSADKKGALNRGLDINQLANAASGRIDY